MYKRTRNKIEKLKSKYETQYVAINRLYEKILSYENGESDIDEVISEITSVFDDACDEEFMECQKEAIEIFSDILKYFTRKKKGLYDIITEYAENDRDIIEGYMCTEYLLMYVSSESMEDVLAVYRLYIYFRYRKMMLL